MEYTNKGIEKLKKFLVEVPERLGISDEEIAEVLGCDREEYERLIGLESWPVERRERGYLFLGIDIKLGTLFGEGRSENYLKEERKFIRVKNLKLGNRSLLEMLMDGTHESLMRVNDYVLDIRGLY